MNTGKTCVVVSCHPSDDLRSEILQECVKSFRTLEIPIFISSHVIPTVEVEYDFFIHTREKKPLTPEEIQQIQHRDSSHIYFSFGERRYVSHCNIFEQKPSYHFEALENVINAMKFCKEKGFTHAIVTDGDNIMSEEDLRALISLFPNEEKALFFRVQELKLNAFSSLLYFTEIDFFLSKMNLDRDEYVERSKQIHEYTLEKHYAFAFRESVKTVFAEENNLVDIFTSSKMDTLCSTLTNGEINFCGVDHSEEVFLFAKGAKGKVKVFHEDEVLFEQEVHNECRTCWSIRKVETDSWKFPLKIEYECNDRKRTVFFSEESWNKHLFLNIIFTT